MVAALALPLALGVKKEAVPVCSQPLVVGLEATLSPVFSQESAALQVVLAG